MKNLISFFLLVFATISCNDSNDQISIIANDPTKLAKVIFDPKTPNEKHWNFYSNGLLKEITKSDGTILQTFVYDTNNNLLNNTASNDNLYPISSNSFAYDNNNHITLFNGNLVVYIQSTNSYLINYNPLKLVSEDLLNTIQIDLNNELLIKKESANYLSSFGNYTFLGVNVEYNSNNTLNYYDGIQSSGYYSHSTTTNPLKYATLPICKALSLVGFRTTEDKWVNGELTSSNNVTTIQDDSGIEKNVFSYTYNSHNLPNSRTTKSYNSNNLESTRLSILYYYQGDVIPQ